MVSVYPLWIERLVFFTLITLGIYLGIVLGDTLSGIGLIVARFCGIPLMILVFTEGIGRGIQSALSN